MMSTMTTFTGLLAVLSLLIPIAHAQVCPTLLWSDEFDGTALNASNWEHQVGDGCQLGQDLCGWGNAELEWYQEANTVVGGGFLKITARQETVGGKPYTSSRIRSLNKQDFDLTQNLRMEARIKVPPGKGMWPAFWMLPTNLDVTQWPLGGEIDIMEFIGREPRNAHGYLHYGNLWNDRTVKGGPIRTPDLASDQFHVYAIEKTPNRIDFFFDGHLFQTYTKDDVEPKFTWPFENTFHFILNLAVGGHWPEYPDDTTVFPATLEVDYVRVYQLPQQQSVGHITGSTLVHVNQTNEAYCVENGIAYNSIAWTVPQDATYTETSSTCISVTFGSTSGYVQATTQSACGQEIFQVPVEVSPFYGREFSFLQPNAATDAASLLTSTGNYNVQTVDGEPTIVYDRNIAEVYDSIQLETQAIANPELYLSQQKKFFMDIQSATAAPCTRVLIQLEDSSTSLPDNYPTGRHSRYIAFIDDFEGWQRLEFDFYDQPMLGVANVDRIVILIDSFEERADQYWIRNFDSAMAGCTVDCEALSTNDCRKRAKSERGACTDGFNNDGFGYDGDGPIDCDDSDCWDDPACLVPPDTMSPTTNGVSPPTLSPGTTASPNGDTSVPTVETSPAPSTSTFDTSSPTMEPTSSAFRSDHWWCYCACLCATVFVHVALA